MADKNNNQNTRKIKNIPKGQSICNKYFAENHTRLDYIITKYDNQVKFCLYKVNDDNTYTKIGTKENPYEFTELYQNQE